MFEGDEFQQFNGILNMPIPELPKVAIRRKMEGGIHNLFCISSQQSFLFGSHRGIIGVTIMKMESKGEPV